MSVTATVPSSSARRMFFCGLRTSAATKAISAPAAVGEEHEDHGRSRKFSFTGGRAATAGDGRRGGEAEPRHHHRGQSQDLGRR